MELVMPLLWVHTLSRHGAWRERQSPGGALNRTFPEYAAGALHMERVYCTPSFASKKNAARRELVLVCDRALYICICRSPVHEVTTQQNRKV